LDIPPMLVCPPEVSAFPSSTFDIHSNTIFAFLLQMGASY
jgi:hypothetical protein